MLISMLSQGHLTTATLVLLLDQAIMTLQLGIHLQAETHDLFKVLGAIEVTTKEDLSQATTLIEVARPEWSPTRLRLIEFTMGPLPHIFLFLLLQGHCLMFAILLLQDLSLLLGTSRLQGGHSIFLLDTLLL